MCFSQHSILENWLLSFNSNVNQLSMMLHCIKSISFSSLFIALAAITELINSLLKIMMKLSLVKCLSSCPTSPCTSFHNYRGITFPFFCESTSGCLLFYPVSVFCLNYCLDKMLS